MKYTLTVLRTVLVLVFLSACSMNLRPSASPTATVIPGTGQVMGILQLMSNGNPHPVKNSLLYLAETIKDSSGNNSFAAMDRIHSPRTESDDNGRFTFVNIPPGNYGLILDQVSSSYLLLKPGSQEVMIISVSADERVDLGTLTYASLPVPANP
jgi:hypothetical protein